LKNSCTLQSVRCNRLQIANQRDFEISQRKISDKHGRTSSAIGLIEAELQKAISNFAAIEMTMAKNGVWSVAVPLSPGHYSYRFIVDGQWCDDPHCTNHIPNSFSTTNGVIKVI
jgi:hypothetical protein